MPEINSIAKQHAPITTNSLADDLRAMGLTAGDSVIVHSSLSSIGWVCGGAIAVIQSLQEVLTSEGVLVMPAQSGHLTDPAQWQSPPVPRSWWQVIRDTMPAFDPAETPTHGIGVIPETFRRCKGVVRSNHPASSLAAWGKDRQAIIATQTLDNPYGMSSPLGKLYERNGKVLFIGTSHQTNTMLHLAETLVEDHPTTKQAGPVIVNGQRRWVTYTLPDYEAYFKESFFLELGAAFEAAYCCTQGPIGRASSKVMSIRDLVDFAVDWIAKNYPLSQ